MSAQHDPNPRVPWKVLAFCSQSVCDPVPCYDMIHLRSLNYVIASGRSVGLIIQLDLHPA